MHHGRCCLLPSFSGLVIPALLLLSQALRVIAHRTPQALMSYSASGALVKTQIPIPQVCERPELLSFLQAPGNADAPCPQGICGAGWIKHVPFPLLTFLACKLLPDLLTFHTNGLITSRCIVFSKGHCARWCWLRSSFALTALVYHITWFFPCSSYWMFPDALAQMIPALTLPTFGYHSPLVFSFVLLLFLKICKLWPEYD